ncbi:hypothetical protein HF521_003323 [Silurus meridionalis]|uniref:Uncharacterized protein n=1 Tax=Silurus meridionalis TaxID=175797 RepID=A0A8T0B4A3_SILME|nr:hypothetical protein HF521_003323 [Silurus meridionalis]
MDVLGNDELCRAVLANGDLYRFVLAKGDVHKALMANGDLCIGLYWVVATFVCLSKDELGSSKQRGRDTRAHARRFCNVTDDRTHSAGAARSRRQAELHEQVKKKNLKLLEMFLRSTRGFLLTLCLLLLLSLPQPSIQGRIKGRWNKGGLKTTGILTCGHSNVLLHPESSRFPLETYDEKPAKS